MVQKRLGTAAVDDANQSYKHPQLGQLTLVSLFYKAVPSDSQIILQAGLDQTLRMATYIPVLYSNT